MTPRRTYLDHNATQPLRPAARAAMLSALDVVGNPSSVHAEGRQARALIEAAREQVARFAGARPADVVFTSGATEANNAVLSHAWRSICFSRLEHPSVLAPIAAGNGTAIELPVSQHGVVDIDGVAAVLDRPATVPTVERDRSLIVLQAANNEIGTLQPISEIVELAAARGARVMSDAVQAAGRIPLAFADSGIDYMTLSAHKIGGPKGVGALIIRDGAPQPAWMRGGGQERRRRGGTENVAAIAGFGAAAEVASVELPLIHRLAILRDRLEVEARSISPALTVIGAGVPRLANTSCIAVTGQSAEALVIKLDLAGVAVSAGSACSSGKVGASTVLAAIGVAPQLARAAIRVSLGWNSTAADVDAFTAAWTRLFDGAAAQRAVA